MRSVRAAPKRAVDLSRHGKLVDMVRDMGMNQSQTVDALLTRAVLKPYWARWNAANAEAIHGERADVLDALDALFGAF